MGYVNIDNEARNSISEVVDVYFFHFGAISGERKPGTLIYDDGSI